MPDGAAAAGGAPGQPGLLAVDDDADTRQALEATLRRFFPWARIATAASARTALPLVRQGDIDLVLCDQVMPGMDGLTLLRRIRFEGPAITRILLTGSPDDAPHTEAVGDGVVDHYLLKPVETARLVYTIATCLWLQHEEGRGALDADAAAAVQAMVRELGPRLRGL